MSNGAQSTVFDRETGEETQDWGTWIVSSPVLWGSLFTVAFYSAIPYLPAQRELANRYFCGHWIEYCTTALFFVGMAILGVKFCQLPSQKTAFGYSLFRDKRLIAEKDPAAKLEFISASLNTLPPSIRRSWLVQRYREVSDYLASGRSAEALEDHLKYLSDIAGERMHDSYALVRTITWAVPILGFLGTVIGITLAIANITPDQLDTSLSEVTAGLGVAFDTTALSLSLSMVLVFTAFVVERSEQQVLSRVELVGVRDIVPAFPPVQQGGGHFELAERQAASQLLQGTETLVTWQTELWRDGLESLRKRWHSTIESQQLELTAALQSGMQTTLADHARQLEGFRTEFAQSQQALTQDVARIATELRETAAEQQAALARQTTELWQAVQGEAQLLREGFRSQTELLLATLSREIEGWQRGLGEINAGSVAQTQALAEQTDVLLRIVSGEEDLARLQERLAENLEVVRSAGMFEETLHSLTAAVHLLTIRNRAA